MKIVRRHPLFFTLVAICVIAIGVEAWFVLSLRTQERVLEQQLNQKITEIEHLQRQRPGPTQENLRRVRDDFAQHAEVLATMLRSLRVTGADDLPYFDGEPADRTKAYFDIVVFVEAMRKAAAEADVLVRPDERFGFAAYTNEGPEPDLVRPVYRQRRIIEYLLGALLPARPRTLVSVQREDPRTIVRTDPAAGAAPGPARPASPVAGGAIPVDAVSDLFVIDPQVSARTPGYVETMAFRITFTGHTGSLRGFMNALAVPEIPLVVRSVEVEPLRDDAARATTRITGRPADGAAQPVDHAIVADNESRFIVTVELFEVKIRAPDPAGGAPKP